MRTSHTTPPRNAGTKRSGRARVALAVVAIFAVVALFVVRLVDIQLVRADELNADSRDKRGQEMTIYGVRGEIVDTNGAVLADSVLRYDITASPREALTPRRDAGAPDAAALVMTAMMELGPIVGLDPAALSGIFTSSPDSNFVYLAKGVTLEEYQKARELDIPWMNFERRPARSYPNGEIAGNLVGFIGTDGPQEGIEMDRDECLASRNGTATYERAEDGMQLPGSVVTTEKPRNGGKIRLTIDRDLNFMVQQRMEQAAIQLGATWATAVVIRIGDGHLMAVADWPTVDPNNVDGAERDARGSRAFSWAYEPGSTMKALTAASLVDAGVATAASPVVSPYALEQADGSYITDAFRHATVNLTLAGALVESSNTAIAQFTDTLDAGTRYDYMKKFGLGEYTESGLSSESSGTVRPAGEWFGRTNYAVQFGQGMTATSVQMASVFQTLGNSGVRMPVTLVEGCEWPDGTVTEQPAPDGRQVVSAMAADQTVAMMEQVANKSGSASKLQIPGYRTAVKSGTAQVAENGGYVGNKVVLSYAGVAPADDPQYAVVVTAGVTDTIYSGQIATTWRDVMAQTLTTFRVPPSTSPAPDLPINW